MLQNSILAWISIPSNQILRIRVTPETFLDLNLANQLMQTDALNFVFVYCQYPSGIAIVADEISGPIHIT